MKKTLLIMGLVLTLLLAACSNTDANMSKETTEAMTKEMSKETTEAMTKEMSKATTEAMTKEMSKETTEAMTKEMSKETTEAMTKEMSKATTEAMTKEMSKETTEAMTKEMSKETTESMTKVDMMNEGEMAIDFTLTSLKGETVMLSELKGQKVYLKFWATWCPICVKGLPDINKLSDGMQDFKVYTIVAPGMGGEKDMAAFKTWFDELGYDNIEVLFDETGQVFKDYQVRAVPYSVMIGSDGVAVIKAPGHLDNQKIVEKFSEIK